MGTTTTVAKTFLGETGRFNGEEIIEIIARQEATAHFISTRLFQFFAADEIDAEGEQAIQAMMQSYFDSGHEIRAVLRTLFHSDYFAQSGRAMLVLKGPVELLVGAYAWPGATGRRRLGAHQLAYRTFYMGQGLLQPPSVEGWHEGLEWIDSGSLLERINFIAKELSNVHNPGVRAIIDRLASRTVDPDARAVG